MSQERPLKTTSRGATRFIEREASEIEPLQFFREAIQNEIEAGATKIIIDGYKSPEGFSLTRVSGDGCGMTRKQLVNYLSTILDSEKGEDNYGVGARVASLAYNPAGVVYASKTSEGSGMVLLHKKEGEYTIKLWNVEDGEEEEVVIPFDNELSNVPETGTAVILHGNGTGSTWNNHQSYEVHRYLANRYFRFPNDVHVYVSHLDSTENRTTNRTVTPFGDILNLHSTTNGSIPFKNINGLSGTIEWWLMPKGEELRDKVSGHNSIGYGIGLLVQNEVFGYKRDYMTDFGILYKSLQSKIIILIDVNKARMSTNRASIVYPKSGMADKTQTPWKLIGKYFSDNMPSQLKEELDKYNLTSSDYTDKEAMLLDPEWQKSLYPVSVAIPAKTGDPIIGETLGNGLPPGKVIPLRPETPGPHHKPGLAAYRKTGGTDPGKPRKEIVVPRVRFISKEEMPDGHQCGIFYTETTNEIVISEEMVPYKREIQLWVNSTGLPQSTVTSAVQSAYHLEYPAHIIDCNVQKKVPFPPQIIEELKSDAALYGKALGRQSLAETIRRIIQDIMREQRSLDQEETDQDPESRTWSKKQEDYLRMWAGKKPVAEMAKYLKRTLGAVRQKALAMGLSLETRGRGL
jgi:hypothetical protein